MIDLHVLVVPLPGPRFKSLLGWSWCCVGEVSILPSLPCTWGSSGPIFQRREAPCWNFALRSAVGHGEVRNGKSSTAHRPDCTAARQPCLTPCPWSAPCFQDSFTAHHCLPQSHTPSSLREAVALRCWALSWKLFPWWIQWCLYLKTAGFVLLLFRFLVLKIYRLWIVT